MGLLFLMIFLDTDNDLANEIGGYQNLVVSQRLKVVNGDAVQSLENLPRGTTNGDCIQLSMFNFSTDWNLI